MQSVLMYTIQYTHIHLHSSRSVRNGQNIMLNGYFFVHPRGIGTL